MLAPLDHDRDHILRFIIRREANKPGNRVLFALGHRLRSAGLARDLHTAQARFTTRAALFINHFPKTAPGQFDLFSLEIKTKIPANFRRRGNDWDAFFIQERLAIGVGDALHELGIIGDATVGDSGIYHRELQRCDQIVPLPNGNIRGVGRRPAFARIMDAHPIRARQYPGGFSRDLDSGSLTQAERITGFIDGIDSGSVSELIKEGVTRDLDRVRDADGAMAPSFFANPAMKKMVAVRDATAAIEMLAGQTPPEASR